MTTGQLIKAARKAAGMTQEELGRKLGVSGSAIAQYETDNRKPKIDTLNRIGAALNEAPWDLMGDELTIEIPVNESFTENMGGTAKSTLTEKERISIEESNRLLVALGLIEEGQDLSDDDLAFLEHIIGQLDVWFGKHRNQPSATPQSPPAPQEGKDTTPPPDAPETPPEGE